MTTSACGGTLIAPDLVATAGHCMPATGSCSGKRIVFGATNVNMLAGNAIPADRLYSCAEVVAQEYVSGRDWAVMRLDRQVPATVATPASVGTTTMTPGTGLMMIGHPNGLPRKYAGEATVASVSNSGSANLRYLTDLDAFGSNSGSGVFTTGFTDDGTGTCYPAGLLVGIVVTRSGTDYDTDTGCPSTYEQGLPRVGVSGALTLVPHASSTSASTTSCPPPPPDINHTTNPGTTVSPPPPTTTPPTTRPPSTDSTSNTEPTTSAGETSTTESTVTADETGTAGVSEPTPASPAPPGTVLPPLCGPVIPVIFLRGSMDFHLARVCPVSSKPSLSGLRLGSAGLIRCPHAPVCGAWVWWRPVWWDV